MNVMGISGTPRKNGNSELLLRSALKPFKDNGWNVKTFLLSELTIKPCNACESCRETGTCTINDEMQLICDAFRWCRSLNALGIGCVAVALRRGATRGGVVRSPRSSDR